MKNEELHAILVDKSLKDLSMLDTLNVLGEEEGSWTLYKISILEGDLEETTKKIQENMLEGAWYFHFYNEDGSRLVIVYKDKVFFTDCNAENWRKAIEYGESLGIPKEQLDFSPNTFADEKY